MPDYNLGRAHGRIEIDYDGSGADRAARDLDRVSESSTDADKSLSKTQRTVQDTGREFDKSAHSADGYSRRLRDVHDASVAADRAEQAYHRTLLDTRSSIDDITAAHNKLERARERYAIATERAHDAHRALHNELGIGQRVVRGLSELIPNARRRLVELGNAQQDLSQKTNTLAKGLGAAAKVVALLGPQGRAAAVGLEVLSKGMDKAGQSASAGSSHIGDFIRQIAQFEVAFGKVAGLSLGIPSLGGLAGIGGAAGLQGLVNVADAVRQLSGLIGLLPATVAGVGFSVETLKVAFHGVGDAIGDMMSDDPTKFLEDIADMAPVAAQSMLQIAQFRDQFKLAGAAVQDSFFSKIADDIAPLIQTWLPAVTSAMSQVAGVFGVLAHEFAGILAEPAMMHSFQMFIDNLSDGLQAMLPALRPLANIFNLLLVQGSSFFEQIGGRITNFLTQVNQMLSRAQSSGQMNNWIQTGINAFGNLVDIIGNVGQAFAEIMIVAENFGGGGFLGWLQELTAEFANWTKTAGGQNALRDFFSTMRQATDAFLPAMKPLIDGLVSLGSAFVQLGIGIAPGWQTVFDSFARTMAQLAPQIASMAPALDLFLAGLAQAFRQLMSTLGPELPHIFQVLADAFVALLPQLQPLTQMFIRLIEGVGPYLPGLFGAVTDALNDLIPLVPSIVGLIIEFTRVIEILVNLLGGLVDGIGKVNDAVTEALPRAIRSLVDMFGEVFDDLPRKAFEWGKNIVKNLALGLIDSVPIVQVGRSAKSVVEAIAGWFQRSPAQKGPFSGSGYTLVRGRKMVQDMAAGMLDARPAIEAAAASTAIAASGALGISRSGGGRAPVPGGAEGVGGALLPDHIAAADTSILDAYLRHEFSDRRGLKGLAADLGEVMSVLQNGFNLFYQQGVQPIMQVMGLLPAATERVWQKIPADVQLQEMQRKALQDRARQGPTWTDVFGRGSATHTPIGQTRVGRLTTGSSIQDRQLAIIAKGKALGLSDQEIQGVLGVAQLESQFGNVGFMGFGPEAKAEGINIDADPQAALDLFFRNYMAGGHGASGPTKDQVVGPGGQIIDQQGYIDFLWHRVQGAADPEFGRKLAAAIADQTALYPDLLTQLGSPSWQQVTGAAPDLTGLQLPNVRGAHWQLALALAAVQRLFPGAVLTAGKDDHSIDKGWHPKGQAIDIGFQGNDPERLAEIASWLLQFTPQIEQLIFSGPGITQNILGGKRTPAIDMSGSPYTTGAAGYHGDHIHLAITDQMAQAFAAALGSDTVLPPSVPAPGLGTLVGRDKGQLVLPSGKTLQELRDATNKNISVNDRLLQAYLAGNPALAAQIGAAQTPGADDQQVLDTLNSIDTTIAGLQAQDAIGNQNTISALTSTQQQLAQQRGFTQGPTQFAQGLQIAGAIGAGASNIVTSVIQAIQSGLDSLAATQDIADTLVYGIRHTEDVMKIVDDVQKYITFAADVANATGNVLQTVGSIIALAGQGAASAGSSPFGGDPGAAVAAAGQGFQFAGMIAQMISGALQGVNAAIDFAQQVYHIAGTYVGRFMAQLIAGPDGTPLLGDVRFLLNTNTGQLLSYSTDNPGNQNALTVPGLLRGAYGYGEYGRGGNPNPGVGQLNIYAGPGQSPAEMMRESMWLVNTGGLSGALSPSAF
ncbi:hypothetical protein [Mycobacterium canetti]|uniref:phage tail protein n=1 Tax=Mycobacterium canetti TaxID=78331 RepID=UPI001E296D86|nr:hypothetical protein [Mycobacterium canetti]